MVNNKGNMTDATAAAPVRELPPVPSLSEGAGSPKQISKITKFEDVIQHVDEAIKANDLAKALQTLEEVKRFAKYRLDKIKVKTGDTGAGQAVVRAMEASRTFKPWKPTPVEK